MQQSYLTPAILADFGTCPRRYELAHVRGLRSARHRTYDQNVRWAFERAMANAVAARALPMDNVVATAVAAVVGWHGQTPEYEDRAEDAALAQRLLRGAGWMLLAAHHDRELAVHVRSKGKMPLVNVVAACRLPRLGHGGELSRRAGTWYKAYLPAVWKLSSEDLLLRLHHFTRNPDRAEVTARLRSSLTWRGPAWVAEQVTGKRVAAVEWIVARLKMPSPLPVELADSSPVLMRRNTDTDLYELDQTVRQYGDQLAADTVSYWRERLRDRAFVYAVTVDADPLATREWAEDAVRWDHARQLCHRTSYWPRNDAACMGRTGLCTYATTCALTGDAEGEARFIRRVDDGLPSNRTEVWHGRR